MVRVKIEPTTVLRAPPDFQTLRRACYFITKIYAKIYQNSTIVIMLVRST